MSRARLGTRRVLNFSGSVGPPPWPTGTDGPLVIGNSDVHIPMGSIKNYSLINRTGTGNIIIDYNPSATFYGVVIGVSGNVTGTAVTINATDGDALASSRIPGLTYTVSAPDGFSFTYQPIQTQGGPGGDSEVGSHHGGAGGGGAGGGGATGTNNGGAANTGPIVGQSGAGGLGDSEDPGIPGDPIPGDQLSVAGNDGGGSAPDGGFDGFGGGASGGTRGMSGINVYFKCAGTGGNTVKINASGDTGGDGGVGGDSNSSNLSVGGSGGGGGGGGSGAKVVTRTKLIAVPGANINVSASTGGSGGGGGIGDGGTNFNGMAGNGGGTGTTGVIDSAVY